MLKQKIAIVAATLFLLTTLVVPGAVFAAAPDPTTGETLVLGGSLDVWFDGYADDATPTAITFTAKTDVTKRTSSSVISCIASSSADMYLFLV